MTIDSALGRALDSVCAVRADFRFAVQLVHRALGFRPFDGRRVVYIEIVRRRTR